MKSTKKCSRGAHGQLRTRLVRLLSVFLLAMCVVGFGGPRDANASVPAPAPETRIIQPRAKFETVLNTYKSFTTANYPDKNVAQYEQSYRELRYQGWYELQGIEQVWTQNGFGPNGFFGFITFNRCVYKTY